MKKLTTTVMTVCCIFWLSAAFAATAQRTYQEAGHFYVIDFDYSTDYATIPLTNPPGQPHYNAEITVYEIVDGNKKQLAIFGGQYTANGCFEDDPKYLVDKAKQITKNR
jgi:hypothetical protein